MREALQDESRPRLEGWKEIAKYFGRSIRAVQDWEADGLKIYRFQNRVWAYIDDLEQFKAARLVVPEGPERLEAEPTATYRGSENALGLAETIAAPAGIGLESRVPPQGAADPKVASRPRRGSRVFVALVAGGTILFGGILFLLFGRAPRLGQPSSFTIERRLLTVFDEHNRKLWDYVVPNSYGPKTIANTDALLVKQHKFVDLNGDGRKELLVGISDSLYCFQSDGRVAWTHRPGRTMTTKQGKVVPGTYFIQLVDTLSKPRGSGGRIVVGASQGPGATFVVELLNKDGQTVGEYYHFGWFMSVRTGALKEGGDEDIFLGGVDNTPPAASRDHGVTLVVLNPDRVEGQAATLEGDDQRALKGLPIGREKAVLLMRDFAPGPDPHYYCRVADIRVYKEDLEVEVNQGDDIHPRAHFRLDGQLKVQSVMPGLLLRKILTNTVLSKNTPSERDVALQSFLGDVLYIRNEFATK